MNIEDLQIGKLYRGRLPLQSGVIRMFLGNSSKGSSVASAYKFLDVKNGTIVYLGGYEIYGMRPVEE